MIAILRRVLARNKRLSAWLPLMLISLIISYLSHEPHPPKVELDIALEDKLLHLIAYTVWSACFLWGYFWQGGKKQSVQLFALILGATALFGAYDEIHQAFVPNRTTSLWDWVADCLGAVVTFFILKKPLYNIVIKLQEKHEHL
jgi:VanZ family protein